MYQSCLQAVLLGRRLHELPRALGARLRQRVGLEPALDDRDVGQVERQPLGAEDVLNHRQVLRARASGSPDVVAKPALQQLDGGQDLRILREWGRRARSRRGPALTASSVGGLASGFGKVAIVRISSIEAGSVFVREAVALRERRDLVGVDPIDQPIEMLAHPRIGPGAVGRLEQHVDGAVELDAGALEVSQLQLAFTGGEMVLRCRGSASGSDRGGEESARRAGRRGAGATGGLLNLRIRAAGRGDHQNDRRTRGHQGLGTALHEHWALPRRSRRR